MTNPVSPSDLMKALDDLILRDAPPELAETDITVMSLAKRANIGAPKAKELLDQWVQSGEAEYIGERRGVRGHKVQAWRLVVKGTE